MLNPLPTPILDSPEYIRLSLAAAMTLGYTKGWFFRGALLKCVNLLLTYDDGCKANCSFCGLAGEKLKQPMDRKFIRVPWKTFHIDDVIDRINTTPDYVSRVCLSMVTHPKSREDTFAICELLAKQTDKYVSILIAPSAMRSGDLERLKDLGAERIGVAVDAATPELFEKLRGKLVKGPHTWKRYWRFYEDALQVFGQGMVGVHLICGIGETEKELAQAMAKAAEMGGGTHLFSFFPEKGSAMQDMLPPPMGTYRRIQLSRWLLDHHMIRFSDLSFDKADRITEFGISDEHYDNVVASGEPFETSGCPGIDGKTACNRPYGNEKPGPDIRNFPFSPKTADLVKIRDELKQYVQES